MTIKNAVEPTRTAPNITGLLPIPPKSLLKKRGIMIIVDAMT